MRGERTHGIRRARFAVRALLWMASGALAAGAAVAAMPGAAAQDVEATELAMAGRQLTAQQAAALERTVAAHPADVTARTKLLGYYFGREAESANVTAERERHILWLIENRPDAPVLGTAEGEFFARDEPDAYAAARKAWLAQVEKHADSPAVLGSAAAFFLLNDAAESERLLKRCEALEPRSPKWPERLGDLAMLERPDTGGEAARAAAAKALADYQRALKLTTDRISRRSLLGEASRAAVDAGALDTAQAYARELLAMAHDPFPLPEVDGNAVHYGHLVLGRVALRRGDVKTARAELLAAGRTPGSPNLDSFGPNMTLAKELLARGQRDAVLAYFRECARFWKRDELRQWAADVQAGRTPDFGANLVY